MFDPSLDNQDWMASENPESANGSAPTGNDMTTLSIKKGTSVDALQPQCSTEFGDDVKTATDLRTILEGKGVMVDSDQFVDKDGSLLERDSEGSTQWSDLVAEEAVGIISSSTPDTIPATGDTVPDAEDTVPNAEDTVPATVDAVPAPVDTVPAAGDDTEPAADSPSGADSTPTSGAGGEVGQSRRRASRSKSEAIEEVLTKTGAVVQRRLSQSMHEAVVVVEKVIAFANSSKDKVVESVTAQKARLQNPSEVIEEAGEGEATSAEASPPHAAPALKKASSAFVTPQAKKVDPVKRAATLPAGALPKVDAKPLNLVEEVSQEESSKTRAPAPHASNIADAQFDSLREEVPMPPSLMDFTQEHWDTLCHNNNILKGIRLDDNGPNPSIADLIEPLTMNDIHYALNDMARTETTTTYTERNSKYANNGWTTKALSVTSPWVDASVNAAQEERRASTKDVKTIYTSVFQRYPFVTIGIKQRSLRPSAEFQDAVVAALKQPDHKKKDALNKVFGTYGHVVQMEFDVGALMVKTSTAMTSNEMSQEKFEETIGFEIKTLISHIPVKLGSTAEKGKKVDDYKVEHDTDKQQVYELRGGNARLSPGAWVQTITDYTTWRVIKTSDVIPVVEILPAELQKEIEALTPHAEKPAKPLSGIWVDAIEHVSNPKDEVEANWFKLHRAETGTTGDWFWLGHSLDKNKALIVKENEPGALGLLAKPNKIWDNDGADTREKHAIWDFSPANPEKYVSLGSYFQYSHGGKPEAPPSTKDEYVKNLRAVRKDLLVEATLAERQYWDNNTGGSATDKAIMWEVVKAPETPEKDGVEALETHLFKGFKGVPAQREDHCGRAVYLLKKSAIDIADDYEPPHNHAFVGEPRTIEAGCFRHYGRSLYKMVRAWFR